MKFFRYSLAIACTLGSVIGIGAIVSAETAAHAPVSMQVTAIECPVVSTFMKQGVSNDTTAVTKLQRFLQDSEKLNVDVNGTFDQKTEDAVKAFQKKYADSILAPWGATRASGIVYITTGKKINQLACSEVMILDSRELAVIANYQAAATSSADAVQTAPVTVTAAPAAPVADPVVTYTSDPEDSQIAPMTGPSLTAAAVLAPGSSLMAKLAYYLANLF